MTYRELLKELEKFTDDQLDCDVTVELGPDHDYPGECYRAEVRITGPDHNTLDIDHPIIYVP